MRLPASSLLLSLSLACTPDAPQDGPCNGDFVATEADFTCSRDWVQVGNLRITNRCGQEDVAVDLARNPQEDAQYPLGTMISLNATEAMVKRGKDFDPTNNNWEYFNLRLSPSGATITSRGKAEVKNDLGSCLECHAGARRFDFNCRDGHGCDPLPVTGEQLKLTQTLDPRCGPF
ncbi:MAG: hypothetical protein AB2A00_04270 [Myxococcota bacterium]